MVTQKIYHAAIYVRLSKEDGDVAAAGKAESNSISNQKNLIKDFLKGREYIDSGMYIERLFPALGVRFIAVNDGYDSMDRNDSSDDIIIPFKNLINDAYCRDISVKIRSHLEVKRRNGEFIGSFAAYGYRKKAEDRHKLELDTYAAGVVQDIFRMKLHGMSQDAIANQLNESGILPPAEYKASMGSNYQTSFKVKEKSGWTSVAVKRILTNEIYIGNLVQGRQTTPNHKVKQAYRKEESDWVRIEKNHEPVVSDRDFEVVQRLLAMDTRTAPGNGEVYPLSGLVVCGGCGMPMIRKTTRAGGKIYSYYICATNKATKECSPHSMSTEKLERAVLELLRKHIESVMDLQRILAFICTVPFQQMDIKKLEERKAEKQAEVERCTGLRGMLYEDMKNGMISREEYRELHAAYESRRKNAQLAIRQIDLEMEEILERKSKGFVWLDYFTEHRNIEKLTRNVAVSLIFEVRVEDKNSIEVTFDFDDCYRECMDNLGRLGHEIGCGGNENPDVPFKGTEILAEGNIVQEDTGQATVRVAGAAGMVERNLRNSGLPDSRVWWVCI